MPDLTGRAGDAMTTERDWTCDEEGHSNSSETFQAICEHHVHHLTPPNEKASDGG